MTPISPATLAACQSRFGESDLPEVLAALEQYGQQAWEREIDRVRLTMVELTKGDKAELLKLVGIAKVDYRDILAWQQTGPLPPAEGQKLEAEARALIGKWGKK